MLKRTLRLRNNNDFKNVYVNGKRHYYGGVLLYYMPNTLHHHRIGCVVGKKFSPSAVLRNKQKRILLSACALLLHDLPGHYDLIIIYTNRNNVLPYIEAVKALRFLYEKILIIK